MEIKCPSCGGILEYDVATDMMVCKSCGNKFAASELSYDGNYAGGESDTYNNAYSDAYSDADTNDTSSSYNSYVCKCKSCGAELNYASKTEVTAVCAYCGSRSVNFDRMERSEKPDYIIPFVVSKDKAVSLLKKRIKRSIFAPKDFKDIKSEKVVGVYVPYRSYDMYLYEEMLVRYVVSSGKSSVTKETYRVADVDLTRMTVEASRRFNDEISKKLEPYDTAFYKPFSPSYLSGYFADKTDVPSAECNNIARMKSFNLTRDAIFKTIEGRSHEVLQSEGISKFKKEEYVMLPVWFMPVKYDGETYTITVNGQTGKVVGTVPFDANRVIWSFAGIFIVLAMILCPFMAMCCQSEWGGTIGMGFGLSALALILGIWKFNTVKKNYNLTTSSGMRRFAKERQDRD